MQEPNNNNLKAENMKLYLENLQIIQDNDRLRKKAQQLTQENEALLAQIQEKSSKESLNKNTTANENIDSTSAPNSKP